jgi:hypothetical protein
MDAGLALQAGAQRSSRLSAAEASADWRSAAASAALAWATSAGRARASVGQPGALQIHRLQLYEVFNVRLHPCYEVYGIYRLLENGAGNSATMEARSGGGLDGGIRSSFWRRNRWLKWVAGGLLAAVGGGLAVVVSMLLHRAEPFLRARIVAELQDRFHARVELDSFHISLVDGLWAEGKGLRIWPPAQVEGVDRAGEYGTGLSR